MHLWETLNITEGCWLQSKCIVQIFTYNHTHHCYPHFPLILISLSDDYFIKCGSPVLTCSIHCRSEHNPCHLYRPHCSRLGVWRQTIHMRHAGSSCPLPCVLGDSTTINSSSYHLQNIKCLLLFTECITISHCIRAVTYDNLWHRSDIWTDKFNLKVQCICNVSQNLRVNMILPIFRWQSHSRVCY